uniref:G-protein coupled receptors family 1 profile domain-containing protein n=1 Tax=Parascaris univalens TaxID=6257 RepID=A0A915BI31_PARUN
EKLLYPMCVYFLPLVIISVLNLRILSILNRERVGNESRNLAKEKRTIRLLSAVVVLFFLCHTGGLLIRIYADKQQYSEQFILAKDIVNLLFNINSLANPMLYFLLTRHF